MASALIHLVLKSAETMHMQSLYQNLFSIHETLCGAPHASQYGTDSVIPHNVSERTQFDYFMGGSFLPYLSLRWHRYDDSKATLHV